ncbi:MAG: Gfo/Idh/MocA family oxidoreductase [Chitinophagaceae bacterium]
MQKPIRVGLVGFGMAAKVMHFPFLTTNKNYHLVAVLERNRSEAEQLFPGIRTERSIESLVAGDDIDLVIVTTPNETHFPFAEKAILAGKDVVVEKPFTNTINEATILIELAKRMNVVLSVYQNRRYVADFLTVREILDKKLLGEIVEFEAHYDRYRSGAKPNAWREENKLGSGVLYDLGSHLLDQALVLFGLPEAIRAEVKMQRPHAKADDYFDVDLYYPNHKATLKASMLVREHGPRYTIHGTKGSFIKYGEDPQEVLLKTGTLPNSEDWGREAEENFGLIHTEMNGQIVRQRYHSLQGSFGLYYDNLYETIANGAPLKERPEDGFNTIKLIELALISNKKKATVACTGLMTQNR